MLRKLLVWTVSFKIKSILSVEVCNRYLPSSPLSFESKNGFRSFNKSALVKASRSHEKRENLQSLSHVLTVAQKLFCYKSIQAIKTRTFHYFVRHLRNPGIPIMLETHAYLDQTANCSACEDPNVHPLSFTNSALDKNLLSVSQHKMRKKNYVPCNFNTLFFGKTIAPANTERITLLQRVELHTLKKKKPNPKPTHKKNHQQNQPKIHQENLVPHFPSLRMLILMNVPINQISVLHWNQTVL